MIHEVLLALALGQAALQLAASAPRGGPGGFMVLAGGDAAGCGPPEGGETGSRDAEAAGLDR